jgi:hypothetical protein
LFDFLDRLTCPFLRSSNNSEIEADDMLEQEWLLVHLSGCKAQGSRPFGQRHNYVTIGEGEAEAEKWKQRNSMINNKLMVVTGKLKPPTSRTPSDFEIIVANCYYMFQFTAIISLRAFAIHPIAVGKAARWTRDAAPWLEPAYPVLLFTNK